MSERTVRAYVGLGANLGDAEATLTEAVRALAALPGTRLRGVSRLYATDPVGVTDQPEFRNAVVALDVPALPDPERGSIALLSALKALEREFGRRTRERWGPRELDLDLLVFGRARVNIERPAGGAIDRCGDRTLRRPPRSSRSRIRRRDRACSCSHRWPTSSLDSCRPAGERRWKRPAAGGSGRRAPARSARSGSGIRGVAGGARRGPREPQPR